MKILAIITTIFLTALLVFLALLIAGIFLTGVGYVFTLLFSFELLHSTFFAVSVAFLIIFIYLMSLLDQLLSNYIADDADYAGNAGNDKISVDDEYYENSEGERKEYTLFILDKYNKSRNQKCACGSGRKYKNCCGKS